MMFSASIASSGVSSLSIAVITSESVFGGDCAEPTRELERDADFVKDENGGMFVKWMSGVCTFLDRSSQLVDVTNTSTGTALNAL